MTGGWATAEPEEIAADIRRMMEAASQMAPFTELILTGNQYDIAVAAGMSMGGIRRVDPPPLPMTDSQPFFYTRPAPQSVKLDKWGNRQRAKAKATAKRVAASKAARKARKR